MKKIILIAFLLCGIAYTKANAQGYDNPNILIQPLWGPVGYAHVEYYYFPDIDLYYYVPGSQYIYREGKHWATVTTLPLRFKNFDFYGAHKVVMNEPKPFMNYSANRRQYAQYKRQHDQVAIRDSREQRYLEKKDHPQHGSWVSPQDVQDKQNRENEQNRVTVQNKQDSLNRADQLAKENLHNQQDMQNKQELNNKEDEHNKEEQKNKEQLQKNENNHKH